MTFPDAFAVLAAIMRRCGPALHRVRIHDGVLQKQMKWNESWRRYNLDVNTAMRRTWTLEEP